MTATAMYDLNVVVHMDWVSAACDGSTVVDTVYLVVVDAACASE